MRHTLLIGLFLVGCGRKDDVVSQFADLRDRMCACDDWACEKQVGGAIDVWEKGEKKAKRDGTLTKAQAAELDTLNDELERCRSALVKRLRRSESR